MTLEEQKALAYQAQIKRREAFRRFLLSKLKAPEGPANQVKRNFEPLRRN